ncbi:2-oxoglutarate dehydrogenase complex dihydrolipoyllysine-residue succinyltransferase [Pelagibacteraceae bacterium]|jgi:2-oxoglutarate dehydrogenase E2 component (dihydrolipoamide succinyltransferase)|nr:2-oxoglutarate dehydrogenase complex dihydrolipoyllysine-residue succinyltransferase [Pelagibacteraceae bacterium]|tara:strand:+ start:14219 stop:15505 length:1287 start_codon:yes stop_codon:yes gene_type:complete
MSEKILVPALGESVTEATVSKWLKNQGESVTSDEPLVELETDKVNIEVPAPSNGVLETISVQQGETVNVGALLGTINENSNLVKSDTKEDSKYTPPLKKIEPKKKEIKKENVAPLELDQDQKIEEVAPLILDQVLELKNEIKSENIISPSARKLATESKIDLKNIKGSGKNGVVLKEDVMSLMGVRPEPLERRKVHGPEERIKMTRLRLTIAKRLKEAQENAAMLTTFNEVDMSEVILMRNNYKDDFQKKYSVKLGFMSFFVKSCVVGLQNYPAINAEIQEDEIVYKNYYNISIAVGTDRGLVVPVLRNTDEMSFADIENNINQLGQKARDGKITIEDLQGGTFTITNGGIYGSMLSTPILNPPQSAVLGMHNIVERPVVINGEITVRPIMYLALSYDHRIIDGKEAVSFLKTIKECLEQPKRLFLNL